jgi:hypothetical protein
MTKPHPTKRKLGIFPRKFKINSSNIDDGQYFYVYCEQLKKTQVKNITISSNQVVWSDPYSWDVDAKNNWLLIQAHPKAALVSAKKLMDDDGDLTITITFDPSNDTEDVVYGDVDYEPENPPVAKPKQSMRKANPSKQKSPQAAKGQSA